ncbi:uncharacterized protein [Hetaerina americana]|uniref:uncharacterized protein n=1 Tax=Hetaerina americana TaxID=62018 RepID=UPI003A7F5914
MDCTKFMHGIPLVDSETQSLQAIRALHQTVVSLRTALDKSKSELQELKSKSITEVEADIFKGTIEKLSLENHILRQRVLFTRKIVKNVENLEESKKIECENVHSNYMDRSTSKTVVQGVGISNKENLCSSNDKRDELPEKEDNPKVVTKGTFKKEDSDNSYLELKEDTPLNVPKVNGESDDIGKVEIVEKHPEKNVSDNADENFNEDREADSESEELDDIELIFTTEDTKDLPTAQENLVSITDAESWNAVEGTPVLLKYTEAQQFDEVSEDDRAEKDECKGNRGQGGKGSEYELEKTWENPAPVETDISKCGIVEEKDLPIASPQKCRRNTLPTPAHHRPIILGETLMPGSIKGKVSSHPLRGHDARPCTIGVTTAELESGVARPILVEGRHGSARRESGAQTDITALPSRWRSEGYLAHKVSHNFTTLPSKFTIPPSPLPSPTPLRDDPRKHFHSQTCRDHRSSTERRAHHRLNEESMEARRTLLSDINFTSMVPELSRSADHLCRDGENVSGIGSMEAGRCLLMGMDLGFDCKYNGLRDEPSHPCCNRRSGDGYRMGCHDAGRRGRGICSSRPTTWDCSMRGNSSGLGPGQASWSSIPSTPNASDMEWNAETLRRNPWKMHTAESPIWASSVPTSPTHFHSTVFQSQPSSYSHQCSRRQSGPPQYYAGRGSTSGWGYDGIVSSGKNKGTIPYSISQTSFSGSFYPRKGTGPHHRQKNRVTFKDSSLLRSYTRPGNSLPDLRDEYSIRGSEEEEESYGWSTSRGRGGNSGSGGDSTDSLIDEAEEYLRRSIDSILTGTDWTRVGCRRQTRRHSDPDPVRELKPPRSAQPFLPKEPKELRPECFAKVILSNGRVVVGRVRYSGILRGTGKEEYIVGVELPCQTGDSDGTFKGIRYFDCNPNRAVFVPFKKVIIAWNT